jgi:sialic acid synthase SpsE
MQLMMQRLDVLVGYSDHTLGIQVPVMAVTLGACLIEKHFTLNKNMIGPDHGASIEPHKLKKMIEQIRKVEIIFGSAVKKPTKSELPMIKTVRKSIVALRDIKKREKFTKKILAQKDRAQD